MNPDQDTARKGAPYEAPRLVELDAGLADGKTTYSPFEEGSSRAPS